MTEKKHKKTGLKSTYQNGTQQQTKHIYTLTWSQRGGKTVSTRATEHQPAVGFAIFFMKILITKLSAALSTEEMLWVPHLLQSCYTFLKCTQQSNA